MEGFFSLDVPSPDRMVHIGERIGKRLSEGSVIGLTGPLGAGKTTLTRGIAQGLGIDPGYVVSSPTYTLLQIYPCGEKELYHLDLYRVSGSDDLDSTGYRDGVGKGKVLVVEWAERVPSVLPPENLQLLIEYDGDGRLLLLRPEGNGYRELVRQVMASVQ